MVVNYISISVLYIFMLGCIQMMKNILCSIAALSFFSKICSGVIGSVSSFANDKCEELEIKDEKCEGQPALAFMMMRFGDGWASGR